ncbi:Clp protease N-terminal domain-containing protein [Planctomycetes bacterium K23_9]|uniref:Negative regulator of genetic competence ClpC/MecB n=1 Tax=Stieleria marina TaxID=1930275 RepID=A0A517P111_9BACT|nr:Negative regulator of genetic competence ClpC/MecB [Planctomycetes bacterium K23_9]
MSVSRRRFIGTTAAMSALAATPALGARSSALDQTDFAGSIDLNSGPVNGPRVEKIMLLASQYALRMEHWHLGTEHLFFALVQESELSGSHWIDDLGMTSEEIDCVINYVVGFGKTTDRPMPTASDLIASDNLVACLEQSTQAAAELGHNAIEPQHLMLGIIDSFGTTANMLLNEMWIERGSIRHVALESLGA